jgi:hypothetical protein
LTENYFIYFVKAIQDVLGISNGPTIT